MSLTTILFDLDGTIVDTEHLAAESIKRVLNQRGIRISSNDALVGVGRKWGDAVGLLTQKFECGLSESDLMQKCLDDYRSRLKTDLRPLPGAVEAIERLSSDYVLGLVSGSEREDILTVLTSLGVRDRFQVILGAEDYPNGKPAPDGYLMALEQLGKKPQEALVFEDSKSGVTSAQKAGIRVVGVQGGEHFNGTELNGVVTSIRSFETVDRGWLQAILS